MRALGLLVRAPASVTDIEERGRAEIIQAISLIRFSAIFVLFLILASHGSNLIELLALVTLVGFVAYLVSRTRHFQWAAVIVILDPILGVPNFVDANLGSLYALISAPIWMSVGPLISSLVFRPIVTTGFILATCVSFGVIGYHVEPEYRSAVASQFLATFCASLLALVGNLIRARNARVIQEERAKVLHSSKLASLGEMAAGVAHELNSPLGAVVLNLEVMIERVRIGQGNTPAMTTRLEQTLQVAERMGKIINGLRAFARESSDEVVVDVPVRTLVDDTLNLCRQRFAHHGIELRLNEDGFDAIARVQYVQVSQALLNLLNNAFDAVHSLPERWVAVSVRAGADAVELVVTDAGFGLPADTAARVFEPFFTTKDYGAGTGLGLSMSRGILQRQGGDLVYEPAARTTFVMRLPTPP